MKTDFEELCNSLSMTEIIRLQNMLSTSLVKRFECHKALVFSDIVGSTPYFVRFGNEAGRQLQQRHLDLLNHSITDTSGRILNTAGDGALLCFDTVDETTSTIVEYLRRISMDNAAYTREHQLVVRTGIHYGPVLTDGTQITGDSVNFCSRVTTSANPGEVRLTKEAFLSLGDVRFRLKCRVLPPTTVKGIEKAVELMTFDWRDHSIFPTMVRLETGEEYSLPDQDIISFGRLDEKDGFPANDIVLQCDDEQRTRQISRWHFELRRRTDGFVMRALSNAPLKLNHRPLKKGEEHPVRTGDHVRVGNVLSLRFLTDQIQQTGLGGSETIISTATPSLPAKAR
jgi:class 3 adenylate cyclase